MYITNKYYDYVQNRIINEQIFRFNISLMHFYSYFRIGTYTTSRPLSFFFHVNLLPSTID